MNDDEILNQLGHLYKFYKMDHRSHSELGLNTANFISWAYDEFDPDDIQDRDNWDDIGAVQFHIEAVIKEWHDKKLFIPYGEA